jgi:hypothetical protein
VELQREIVERQRAEEALQQAKDELEVRVAERTTELRQAVAQLHAEIAERQHTERELHRLPRQTPLILVAEDNIVNQRVSARGSDMTGGSGVENVRGRVISITLWNVCRPSEDYSVEGHTSKRLLVTL